MKSKARFLKKALENDGREAGEEIPPEGECHLNSLQYQQVYVGGNNVVQFQKV